jgi:hypothetical protein
MRKVNNSRSKRAAKRVLRRALAHIKEKVRSVHTHGMHKLNKAITKEKKKLVKAVP